uniref:non-specific serine/threonine protein kinase n=1 Tax=Globodera rostochiensis TaxID=31243 RepID=A0A914HBI8_GLORO
MGCVSSQVDVEAEGRQYRMKRKIASGGFSQLFLAEDVESGDKVAVKKIVCHGHSEADRVRREIGFLLRFAERSEHILSLLAVAEEHPVSTSVFHFSLLFPYCKIGSLNDDLTHRSLSRDFMNQQRVLFLFLQICSAIEFLHNDRPPIAHRDIKPANLMFRDERTLQLIDFGSATECPLRIEDARDSRRILDEAAELCTMPYRAPELFTCEIGAVIGESVDIWSLGCVLYALCYFRSPFDGVHERGDSVALAVQSAKLNFDKDSPFDRSIAELIQSMVLILPSERPHISQIKRRVEQMHL